MYPFSDALADSGRFRQGESSTVLAFKSIQRIYDKKTIGENKQKNTWQIHWDTMFDILLGRHVMIVGLGIHPTCCWIWLNMTLLDFRVDIPVDLPPRSPELLKQAVCFEKCFQKETLQSLDAWPAVFHNVFCRCITSISSMLGKLTRHGTLMATWLGWRYVKVALLSATYLQLTKVSSPAKLTYNLVNQGFWGNNHSL